MIEIKNLCASVENTPILKGFNLSVNAGEIHAIMGRNGAGKSTLAKVIAGHPTYEVTEGSILFNGEELLTLDPEERAQKGLFMGFQYPVEINGVSNRYFLQTALNVQRKARGEKPLTTDEFDLFLEEKMHLMNIKSDMKDRNVNEGFSGGEKKRNEILQMAVLEPKFAILDETDSGLDIDALRIVAHGVNSLRNAEMGLIIITHYQRLLNYIQPHFVHVMDEGRLVQSGGAELAHKLEAEGYDWITN